MLSHLPVIELNDIDSTNNYAIRLIDANKARHGLTITAQTQSAGKGQRGKIWVDEPGQSLLMSIILLPNREINEQFVFNSAVAVAVVNVLKSFCPKCGIRIKWPNDIIINDKKAGGILIENVLRGNRWTHCIVGLGLNIEQRSFPKDLPYATSLRIATGINTNITKLRDSIREFIIQTAIKQPPEEIMAQYNGLLYKRGQKQTFSDSSGKWEATILHANNDGTIDLQLVDGTIISARHGEVVWEWG